MAQMDNKPFIVGQVTAGSSAAALPAADTGCVVLQALSTNSGILLLGDVDSQPIQLSAGKVAVWPTSTPERIYYKRGAEGDKLNYIYFHVPYGIGAGPSIG